MVYRVFADITMIVHFGFILFVAVGAFLAWRWRKLIWAHLLAVGWGVGIVLLGFDCPLTPLERQLRRRGGEEGFDEGWGFVDHYIEGVIYPEAYTTQLRILAAVLVTIGWVGYLVRFRSSADPRGRSRVTFGVGERTADHGT